MLYVDEFGRESPERDDYKNTSFYLDECCPKIQVYARESGNYIFGDGTEKDLEVLDLGTMTVLEMSDETVCAAARTKYKFINNFVNENGVTLLKNVGVKPLYMKWNNYTILHTRDEFYLGLDNNYYIRLYLDSIKNGTVLKVDGKKTSYSVKRTCVAIGFPRKLTSISPLYIPVVHHVKGYGSGMTYTLYDIISFDRYKIYTENVEEFLKLRSKSLLRRKLIRN